MAACVECRRQLVPDYQPWRCVRCTIRHALRDDATVDVHQAVIAGRRLGLTYPTIGHVLGYTGSAVGSIYRDQPATITPARARAVFAPLATRALREDLAIIDDDGLGYPELLPAAIKALTASGVDRDQIASEIRQVTDDLGSVGRQSNATRALAVLDDVTAS